jgi:hypothetical protein
MRVFFPFVGVPALLVAAYRRDNPASRAENILRLRRNSASVKGNECILCGEAGPTWCAKWPKTARARQWEAAHVGKHVREESRRLAHRLSRRHCPKYDRQIHFVAGELVSLVNN